MREIFRRLKGAMTPRNVSGAAITALIIAVAVAVNSVIYALTNTFGLYLYSPQYDDLTISGHTDEMFAEDIDRNRKVTVTFCLDEDSLSMHPMGAYVLETARQFEEKYPGLISLRFVNVITGLYKENASDKEFKIFDFEKYTDENTVFRTNSVIFESETSYRVVTDNYTNNGFGDFFSLDSTGNPTAYIGEEVFASMVSWVLQTEHKKAYFTQNHGETAELAFAKMLACAGYEVDFINLRQVKYVPDDCDLLIISNPTSDFERGSENSNIQTEIDRLRAYVEKGGNVYVAIDPYARRLESLESFLAEYGITIAGRTNEHGVYMREMIKDRVNGVSTDGFTFISTIDVSDSVTKKINDRLSQYGEPSIIIRDAARLELSKNAKAMLVASSSAVTQLQSDTVSSTGGYAIAAYATVDNTEIYKDANIFVVTSSYFTITDAIINDSYSNRDFIYLMLNELMDSNVAPYGCNTVSYDQSRLEGLTMKMANLYTAILIAVPVAIAIGGFIVIRRRKNR